MQWRHECKLRERTQPQLSFKIIFAHLAQFAFGVIKFLLHCMYKNGDLYAFYDGVTFSNIWLKIESS